MTLLEALAHHSNSAVLRTADGFAYRKFTPLTVERMNTNNKFPRWKAITVLAIADLNAQVINGEEELGL